MLTAPVPLTAIVSGRTGGLISLPKQSGDESQNTLHWVQGYRRSAVTFPPRALLTKAATNSAPIKTASARPGYPIGRCDYVDCNVLFAQLWQQRWVTEVGNATMERVVICSGTADWMFETSVDLRSFEGDAGDVTGIELIEEIAVGDGRPRIHTAGRMYHGIYPPSHATTCTVFSSPFSSVELIQVKLTQYVCDKANWASEE